MADPTLLMVDDEAPFVAAMVKRLTKRGLTVLSAPGGREALDILASGGAERVDVVILDVKMPGMDGLETLAAIKSAYPLVEVIMLTAHATLENAIDGMHHGAFDYLIKPCDMQTLMSKVSDAYAARRRRLGRIEEAREQTGVPDAGE